MSDTQVDSSYEEFSTWHNLLQFRWYDNWQTIVVIDKEAISSKSLREIIDILEDLHSFKEAEEMAAHVQMTADQQISLDSIIWA